MKDDLDPRESPAQFDRGAFDSSPDIDDPDRVSPNRSRRSMLRAGSLRLHHGLVGAVAGKSRFGSFESFPDRHSVFDFEWAFLLAREFNAVYDVDPSFVCVIGPDEVRFQHTIVSSIARGYSDAPMIYNPPQVFLVCLKEDR